MNDQIRVEENKSLTNSGVVISYKQKRSIRHVTEYQQRNQEDPRLPSAVPSAPTHKGDLIVNIKRLGAAQPQRVVACLLFTAN